MTSLGDCLIERMNAGIIPGLVAVDEHARAPRFVSDVEGGAPSIDSNGPPAVEGKRLIAIIVELALDDHPALVRDEPRRGQCRAGFPVEGVAILVGERSAGARVPLTI